MNIIRCSWWSRDAKKRESKEERSFLENGSRLLEEQIKSFDRKPNPFRMFSEKELQRATNNYDPKRIFHREVPYNLYKGTYEEDRNISVKKFNWRIIDIEEIINEIVIASQVNNHKNIMKFLGCCLETHFPIIVYEFVGITTLFDHICKKRVEQSSTAKLLPWNKKLMISIEIADAVAYLHSSGSKPIIHRGIKSYNIFVDQDHVAKLPDFTFALTIPLGETDVWEETVVGTFGYIDPNCVNGRFTVKSDVYSFGAVLIEMLTGSYALAIYEEVSNIMGQSEGNGKSIVSRQEVTEQYLKSNVLKEGNMEQSIACAELALSCLKENPEERPVMMEVAQELRRISKIPPL